MFAGICWGDAARPKPLTHKPSKIVIPAHAGTHEVAGPERRKSWVRVFVCMTSVECRNNTPATRIAAAVTGWLSSSNMPSASMISKPRADGSAYYPTSAPHDWKSGASSMASESMVRSLV